MRVLQLHQLIDSIRRQIFVRCTRITEYHRKITFRQSAGVNFGKSCRTIRFILFGIGCRLIIFSGIDTQHRKISGMPRPGPIVRISSEITDCRRRCSYQADILINTEHGHKKLISVEIRFYIGRQIGTGNRRLFQYVTNTVYHAITPFLRHIFRQCCLNLPGDVFHTYQYRSRNSRICQFLMTPFCPKAIPQVIFL